MPHSRVRDEHGRGRPIDQRKIGNQRDRDSDREHDHRDQRQQDKDRKRHHGAKADGDVAAGHDQIAMGEIDRAGRVDDEDEAEGDQRISGAKRDAVDHEL